MNPLTRIQDFLVEACEQSYFQIWISIYQDRFSLITTKGFELPLPFPSLHDVHRDMIEYPDFTDFYFCYDESRSIIVIRVEKPNLSLERINQLEILLINYYLEISLERERFIRHKMMESIRDISNLDNVDTLLTNILEHALSVIQVADFGVLWMYDEKENALLPRAWAGGPSESIQNMRMNIGEGIIGKTYQEKRTMFLSLLKDILHESSSIRKENLQHLFNAYSFTNLQSIISTPIFVENETLCVLIIYQNGERPLFTIEDKKVLESFSDQVSIALTNSRLFQNIKHQNQLLLQRDEIHDTFMKLSLQSSGMHMIASELRRMIQLRLVIIDLTDDSIYSSPNHWFSEDINELRRKFNSMDAPQFYSTEQSGKQNTFYLQPVIGINQFLGMLIVEVTDKWLLPINKLIIEQASSIIALEMIRNQTVVDSYYQKTHDLFHELILCNDASIQNTKAIELGIHQPAYYLIILIGIPSHDDIHYMNMQNHRLILENKKRFREYTPIVFGFRNKITIILQSQSDTIDVSVHLKQLQSEWKQGNHLPIKIGIGLQYNRIEDIKKGYNEADKALSYLNHRKQPDLIHYKDIGINRLFIHQSQEELQAFINEVFLPLQNEKEQNQFLEKTLLTYIKQNRSAGETAKQLHIHVNTLYQRLKKIEEKLHISFSNPEDVLRLQLACYLKN